MFVVAGRVHFILYYLLVMGFFYLGGRPCPALLWHAVPCGGLLCPFPPRSLNRPLASSG